MDERETEAGVPKNASVISMYRSGRLAKRLALRKSLADSRAALRAHRPEVSCAPPPSTLHVPAELAVMPTIPASTAAEFAELSITARLMREMDLIMATSPASTVATETPPAGTRTRETKLSLANSDALQASAGARRTALVHRALRQASTERGGNAAACTTSRRGKPAMEQTTEATCVVEPTVGTHQATCERQSPRQWNEFPEDSEPAPQPVEPAASLATLDFGPGMVVRLNQLGIHDVADLANADVDALRQSLGSISRLIDVSSWIARARRQLRCAMVAAEERDETLPTARETFDMDRRCDYLMPAS